MSKHFGLLSDGPGSMLLPAGGPSQRARAPIRRQGHWPRPLTLGFLAGAILVGCAQPSPPDQPVPTEAEIEARRERIAEFFTERQRRLDVVATTVTESGQIIDWIRPESQVPGGKLAEPPTDARNEPGADVVGNPFLERESPFEHADGGARTEVQLDRSAMGPSGTVPVVRFDLERYLETVEVPPEDPLDVITKVPPPAPDTNDRYYVVWQRFGTFYGSAGRINIWDTSGPVSGETSIGQVAVIRGTPMQAIEAGKIEHDGLNPNSRPHFFTYFRTNGTASGDWIAGYNNLVDGWIQYSSSVAPGMSIVAWESQQNGSQFSLDIEVRLHAGNWWVWAAGEWAGYYPYCKGGDAPPCDEATLFSANGIRDQASRLDWYGEVYDSSAPAATSTDMGSGRLASTAWQQAAYFRNMTYFWAPTTYWWWDSGSVSATDSACYSADGPFYSSTDAWRNWFYFGGPGKEGSGCS